LGLDVSWQVGLDFFAPPLEGSPVAVPGTEPRIEAVTELPEQIVINFSGQADDAPPSRKQRLG